MAWSRKYELCKGCGTTDSKHVAKGFCRKCYSKNIEAKHKDHIRHPRGVAHDFLSYEKLKELYIIKKLSLSDIGRIAGCTRGNVYYKLKKYGIELRSKAEARTFALDKGKIKTTKLDADGVEQEVLYRKIRYDESFFKSWSAEMAYVLGLIFTDGNLHMRENATGYELGILSFAQKERELVQKVLSLMSCDAQIRFIQRREYEKTTSGELHAFSIGNNDLASDLLALGVVPNKSLSIRFPDVPDSYVRHFIRGVFDGDGSVYLERRTKIRVKLQSGSKEFIEALNSTLARNGFPIRNVNGGSATSLTAFSIRYNSKKDVLRFYSFIYDGVDDRMLYEHKRNIFRDYFRF